MIEIKEEYIRVKLTPQCPKTELREIIEDENGKTLKITVRAKPEKNKANIELIKFLSKETGVSTDNIKIISGASTRTKLIKISK
jgi:uncharacterized protein (TIGR00251 family)